MSALSESQKKLFLDANARVLTSNQKALAGGWENDRQWYLAACTGRCLFGASTPIYAFEAHGRFGEDFIHFPRSNCSPPNWIVHRPTDRWTYATNKQFLMASRPRRTTYANASHVIAGRSVSCIARLARLWKYWWKIVLCHDSNRFRIYGLARERQSVDQISEGQRAKCFIKYSPHSVSIEIDIVRDELLSLWAQPMKV